MCCLLDLFGFNFVKKLYLVVGFFSNQSLYRTIVPVPENWREKILHTGNTLPSCMCVIQEYQYYTMSLSQYPGFCQYPESMSVHGYGLCHSKFTNV